MTALPGGRDDDAASDSLARGAFSHADGQVCAMLGTDIVGYTSASRRDEETRQHMRRSFYSRLEDACRRSGIPWDDCFQQDQGDGVLVILPPGSAPASLIDPLLSRLRMLIRQHNRMSVEPARMQVRVAIHIGLVYRDDHGVTSDDITYLTRMLDSGPLRKAVTGSRAEIAVSVSNDLHKVIIQRNPSLADPDEFRHVKCRVKGNPVDMWLHIPGGDQ